MQSDIELGLENDEQILAMGEKNPVLLVCGTALSSLIPIIFLFIVFFTLSSNGNFAVFIKINCILIAVILGWICKYFYDSYQNNQIYLTNKRIIITQKNMIDCVPFEMVHSFGGSGLDISTLTLKSRRKFIFAYTNLNDLKEQYKQIYPFYIAPKVTLREIIFAIIVIFLFACTFIPTKYINKIQNKLAPKQVQKEHVKVTDAESYMEYMQRKLKLHWQPPKLDHDTRVTVEFKIMPDGTIYDKKIVESSGDREMDNSTLFALNESSPLQKLPKDLMYEEEIKIKFTFDYHVKNNDN